MVSYRPGAAKPEWDRTRWKTGTRIALVKVDGIGDFVLATTFLQIFKNSGGGVGCDTVFARDRWGNCATQFPAWTVIEIPAQRKPLKEHLFRWPDPAAAEIPTAF